MEAYRGSGGIASLILNFGARLSDQHHASGCLPMGKEPRYKRLGGSQSRPGGFEKRKNLLVLPRFEPGTFKNIAYLLYRLIYRGSKLGSARVLCR
jgi:hypothetical protein